LQTLNPLLTFIRKRCAQYEDNMKIEDRFKETREKLSALRNREISNEKINDVIDIISEQNELLMATYKISTMVKDSYKDSMEHVASAIDSNNETFAFINTWLEAQNSRNDSVDKEFIRINKIIGNRE